MADRLALHNELLQFEDHVYFQPPESVKLIYPCIIYERSSGVSEYADNKTYSYRQAYNIMRVSKDPDDDKIKEMLFHFPMSRFNTHYVKDNLNHDVIVIFY